MRPGVVTRGAQSLSAAVFALLFAGAYASPLAIVQPAMLPCQAALRAALDSPRSLEACGLFRLSDGRILAFSIDQTVYFIAMDGGRITRFAVNLRSRTIADAVEDPARTRPAVVDPRAFADAKFFYFPFDRANQLRDRVTPARSGYLCLPTQALRLNAKVLSAHACGSRP
jgi:hypothetical protein